MGLIEIDHNSKNIYGIVFFLITNHSYIIYKIVEKMQNTLKHYAGLQRLYNIFWLY